jgi:hypothetical protein
VYFENLYSRNLENLDGVDKFVDAYNQPKFIQEVINHLNRPITSNEIEAVIESSYKEDGFTAEFYQTLKHGLIPIVLKVFQEIEREGMLPNSFYAASITLIPKHNKDATKKENYRPISLRNIDAKIFSKKKPDKQNSATHQKDHIP